MKKKDEQLISCGLDSELDREERKHLEQLKSERPEAAEISDAFDRIGDLVRSGSASAVAPEAYRAWQDIRREIRQSERKAAERPPVHGLRLRWAGALAALLIVGVLAVSSVRLLNGNTPELSQADAPASRVDWVEAEIPGATTMIYTDYETDLTVIWMDIAQNGESRDS